VMQGSGKFLETFLTFRSVVPGGICGTWCCNTTGTDNSNAGPASPSGIRNMRSWNWSSSLSLRAEHCSSCCWDPGPRASTLLNHFLQSSRELHSICPELLTNSPLGTVHSVHFFFISVCAILYVCFLVASFRLDITHISDWVPLCQKLYLSHSDYLLIHLLAPLVSLMIHLLCGWVSFCNETVGSMSRENEQVFLCSTAHSMGSQFLLLQSVLMTKWMTDWMNASK
jgi:hypothetical protein